MSLALQGSSGPVYKQLRQAISLPYPGVLRGTYDHTNGAVSSFMTQQDEGLGSGGLLRILLL